MSNQQFRPYVTYLTAFRAVLCRLCEICIPPNDPLRHYKDHHTAKHDHPIPMEIRHQIADYMATLNLCQPTEIIPPRTLVSGLKVFRDGFRCNFSGCKAGATTESSMRKHYYTHRHHIPKEFNDWEPSAVQTLFDGQHKKYVISILG